MNFRQKWKAQGHACLYCQRPWAFNLITRDHFVPTALLKEFPKLRKAVLAHMNQIPVCPNCNAVKSHDLPNAQERARYKAVYGRLPFRKGAQDPFKGIKQPGNLSAQTRARWCGSIPHRMENGDGMARPDETNQQNPVDAERAAAIRSTVKELKRQTNGSSGNGQATAGQSK